MIILDPTYTATNGTPYRVRIIEQGDQYGRRDCLTYDEPEPMIEFYDERYPRRGITPAARCVPADQLGQFITRYYVKTLAAHDGALDLMGHVPAWWLDGDTFAAIMADAKSAILGEYREALEAQLEEYSC